MKALNASTRLALLALAFCSAKALASEPEAAPEAAKMSHDPAHAAPDAKAWQPHLPQRSLPRPGIHPDILLLDLEHQKVVDSQKPISLIATCGRCHDTAFIDAHSGHSSLGYGEAPPKTPSHAFDQGPGLLGRFDPFVYDRLATGDPKTERADLSLEAWLRAHGRYAVGGGPFVRLGAEMNCLSCHSQRFNLKAVLESQKAGAFADGATAALLGSGLVHQSPEGWVYDRAAFQPDGHLSADRLGLKPADAKACGRCHGLVHTEETPISLAMLDLKHPSAALATGRIYSGQRQVDSALNLPSKAEQTAPFDVHAERLLGCPDCHHSLNNPVFRAETRETRPAHLLYDARRADFGDYLKRPVHDFAKGDAAQSQVAERLAGSMRRCEDCHDAKVGHDWLPYADRHMARMRCESCHIPSISSPVLQAVDWTVLLAPGKPRTEYRGYGAAGPTASVLNPPFVPALLAFEKDQKLAPHNLLTTFYWQESEPERPVRKVDLERAFFTETGAFRPAIQQALDQNGDGELSGDELWLKTPAAVAAIQAELSAVGVKNPRVVAELSPYSLHHNAVAGGYATRSCERCHGSDSQITEPIRLVQNSPAGAQIKPLPGSKTALEGQIEAHGDGFVFRPKPEGTYLFGHSRIAGIDGLGLTLFGLVGLGALGHGLLRILSDRTRRRP